MADRAATASTRPVRSYMARIDSVVEAEPEQALFLLKRRELDLALSYRYRQLGTPLPPGLTAHALFDGAGAHPAVAATLAALDATGQGGAA